MQRLHQIVFLVAVLMLSWLGMQAVHELGHAVGAVATQGTVEHVVLHPLAISRTDVSPNPMPLVVVWCGPLIGGLLPIVSWSLIPLRFTMARRITLFFVGFCLIANGAYISFGSLDGVGDCGVMLQHGSPAWLLLAFGGLTIPSGIFAWHRLGSVRPFLSNPAAVDPVTAWTLFAALTVLLIFETLLS